LKATKFDNYKLISNHHHLIQIITEHPLQFFLSLIKLSEFYIIRFILFSIPIKMILDTKFSLFYHKLPSHKQKGTTYRTYSSFYQDCQECADSP
jgi:hypothetical protein